MESRIVQAIVDEARLHQCTTQTAYPEWEHMPEWVVWEHHEPWEDSEDDSGKS